MARTLNIYGGYTPNKDGLIHYVSNSDLKTSMATYLLASISIDNYRINTDVAKVTASISSYKTISYLIDFDDETHYFKCYFVNNVTMQSDMLIMSLSVDLWATYIQSAKLQRPTITKCNRRLNNNGYYDAIPQTSGNMTFEEYGGTGSSRAYYKNEDVSIVFLLQYNVSQSAFGDEKITTNELYTLDLKTLYDMTRIAGTTDIYPNANAVLTASSIIGGIYSVVANIGENDAQVIKAWLIPKSFLRVGNYGVSVKTKSQFLFSNASVTIQVKKVLPSRYYKAYTISDYNINYVYYAGTFNNGLKLLNTTGKDLNYYIRAIVSDDDIKLIVSQGERQQDISDAISLFLNVNSAVQTTSRKIAEALSKSINMGTSLFKSIEGAKSSADFSIGGLNVIKGITDMMPNFALESARGGGDAFINFYAHEDLTEVHNPFGVTMYESVYDEKEHASAFGANYNYLLSYDTDAIDIDSYIAMIQLLSSGAKLGYNDYNYLFVAISASIHGAPAEACEEIRRQLENGVTINASFL